MFLRDGNKVVVNARNKERLIDSFEGEKDALPISSDLSDPDRAKSFLNDAVNKLGSLDVLVCNIGSGKSVPPGGENFVEWQRVFSQNFWATTNAVEHAIPFLEETRGNIICISSICGAQVVKGAPVTYSCAKAALNAFVRGMARPLGERSIRINAIAPGNILFKGSSWETKLIEEKQNVEDLLDREVAQKRLGAPSDITGLVNYLSSPAAGFITGAVYSLDGGQLR
mgnify:CR=1 FL=1